MTIYKDVCDKYCEPPNEWIWQQAMISVENNLINITQTHTHIRILFASVFRFKHHFIISCFYALPSEPHFQPNQLKCTTLEYAPTLISLILGGRSLGFYLWAAASFFFSVTASIFFVSTKRQCCEQTNKKMPSSSLIQIDGEMLLFIVLINIIWNDLSAFIRTTLIRNANKIPRWIPFFFIVVLFLIFFY